MSNIMTPSQLKYHVENSRSDSYFFTRSTMKFFGDTMRNYGVTSKPVMIETQSGDTVECWELYRRRPVKHGQQSTTYFATDDYRRVFKKD